MPFDPIYPETQVNVFASGEQASPDITTLSDGSFGVVWRSVGQDAIGGDGVFGQLHTVDRVPIGAQFQINTNEVGNQNDPRVTATADGGFVVVWTDQSGIDGSGWATLGQRFDATGVPQGSEFQVNSSADFQPVRG
jgi:hypothetical protein